MLIDGGEVKRMWTAAGHRRKGYASQVLTGLEDATRAAGYSTLLLETGPLQPEAIALYTGRGYHRISYVRPLPRRPGLPVRPALPGVALASIRDAHSVIPSTASDARELSARGGRACP